MGGRPKALSGDKSGNIGSMAITLARTIVRTEFVKFSPAVVSLLMFALYVFFFWVGMFDEKNVQLEM